MLVNAGAWYDAYIAVLLVSALPNLMLFLIPSNLLLANGKKGSLNFQNMMLSFAAAGLLGDVFLHTLPHLIAPHSHSHGDHGEEAHAHAQQDSHADHEEHDHHDHHEHDHHGHDHHDHDTHGYEHDHAHEAAVHGHEEHAHMHGMEDSHSAGAFDLYAYIGMERTTIICVVLLLGFLVFMFAEKMASSHQGHSHAHDHDSDVDCHENEDETAEEPETSANAASAGKGAASIRKSARLKEKAASTPTASKATVASSNTSNATTDSVSKDNNKTLFQAMQSQLKASGWLNLFADSMHNFTDGIAIGASFASGHGLAYATFLSVIFHEIPHEIGDFTILIQSGLTKSQAIQAQFVTAIAAILGTSVGLLARRSVVAEELLLAFTAGGFLYFATVNMLPGIVRTKSGLVQCLLEVVCFVLGVVMMVLVTYLE